MAALPAYVKIGFPQPEEPDSVVMRSDMERGPAKQRRIAADARVQEDVILYFDTQAHAADWLTWFYTEINGGADYFDFPDLRTGTTVQARVVGGKPGALRPSTVNWAYSQRTVTLEWWVSAI